MKASETAQLLTRISAYDRRTLGDADVLAWHDLIGDLEYADAEEAVRRHYAETRDWIMPADVRRHVKAIREARLTRDPEAVPDADPDNIQAYAGALRHGRFVVASGRKPRPVKAAIDAIGELPKAEPPPEIRDRDEHAPTRVEARRVSCPWCRALPGQRCVVPDTRIPIRSTPAHEARLIAAGLIEPTPARQEVDHA